VDASRALDDLLHELEDGQFGTKMRGYDPSEVDALLERAGRTLVDLRSAARRAGERATLAERQLEEELEAARTARAMAEAGIATAEAEAARIVADARAEATDLKSASEAEIRAAIESGRTQMETEVSEAAGRRDRVLEEIEVTAGHVAAHRSRLLRAVSDLEALVEGIDDRPTGVEISPDPPNAEMTDGPLPPLPPHVPVGESSERDWPAPDWSPSDVVTPIRPAEQATAAGVGGKESDLDAFFADDGS